MENKNNEKLDQMIHDSMYKNLDRIEELLSHLYKMVQSEPENEELTRIFEGVLYIAQGQVRTNVDVSDAYFGKKMKEYSMKIAKRTEESLKNLSEQAKQGRTR